MTGLKLLYLEDLPVGQRLTSETYGMEGKRSKEFAAEFDPQPFHVEERAAQISIFKSLRPATGIRQQSQCGFLLWAVCHFANGLVGVGGEIAWPGPTRLGNTLPVESEIVEITPSRSKTVRGTMFNQNGEAVHLLTGQAFSAEAREVIEGPTFIKKEMPLGAPLVAAIELLPFLRDTVRVTRG